MKILLLSILLFASGIPSQALPQNEYRSFVDFVQRSLNSLKELIKPTPPSMKELPDCGKRNIRESSESKLGECFWNCKWRPNPFFDSNPLGQQAIPITATTPEDLLPDAWVEFNDEVFENILFLDNTLIEVFITLPMLPEDTQCLRDCFPLDILQDNMDARFEMCRQSFIESFDPNTGTFNNDNWLIFYECIMLLNSQPSASGDPRARISVARDFFTTAAEICYLGHLGVALNYQPPIFTPAQLLGCDLILLCTIFDQGSPNCPNIQRKKKTTKSKNDIRRKLERITEKYKKSSKNGKKERKKKKNKKNKRKTPKVLHDANLGVLVRQSQDTSTANDSRLTGATIFPVDIIDTTNSGHHPWACSLKTSGFRGRHRCGVTLLSGPTESSPDDPYVLVGTAHCNYICKDANSGTVLETCCCRPQNNPSTCNFDVNDRKKSPYCIGRPIFTLAEPDDLEIICGEFSTDVEIIEDSEEPEQVFRIKKIINHPRYQPNRAGIAQGGPIEGHDISVYHVETNFKLGMTVDGETTQDKIWPICFPKDEDEFTSDRGMIAGWLDTPPVSQTRSNQYGSALTGEQVIRTGFWPRVAGVRKLDKCEDPIAQKNPDDSRVNTYYPQGTICYDEPSFASCVDFGVSGSGLAREWKPYAKGPGVDFGMDNDLQYQYSFVGPLSMSKGCDNTLSLRDLNNQDEAEFIFRGRNPMVATDAICFMPWVARQYGLKMPKFYKQKKSCNIGSGDRNDINKAVCRTGFGTQCDFTFVDAITGEKWDRCKVFSREGIARNVFRCVDTNGFFAPCNNNCKGVDPNSIIGAGVAAVTATGIAVTALAGPAFGFGIGGLAGAGGAMLTRAQCSPRQCNIGGRCVDLVINNGRAQCPRPRG